MKGFAHFPVSLMEKEKMCLLDVLCAMYGDEKARSTEREKSGRQQLQDNAADVLAKCQSKDADRMESLGEHPCRITTLSVDGRGRAQRAMRVQGRKINFRPWHICWVAKHGAPADCTLQYSHRCHEENCCESGHGVWEDDKTNKSRNECRAGSHVILPDGRILLICKHTPPCLTPVLFTDCRVFSSLDEYRAES